jgi:DNA polymerase-1
VKNKAFIIDTSFHIWNGSFGFKKVCKCAMQDSKNKVISFDEECPHCEKGWVFLNANGFRTGGLYQVAKLALDAMYDDYEVVIVFDPPKGDLTNTQILDTYKGNRGETPEHITKQKDFALRFFPMFDNIKCYMGTQDEADDVMAVIALKYKNAGYEDVIIATDDKDLFCVLQYGINLYRQKGIDTHDHFVEKFGFNASRHAEYLAITGDSADNFNLIVGLGPVAATYLINNHPHINDIFKDEYWKNLPEKYKKKLVKFCDQSNEYVYLEEELRTSLQLAELNLNAEYRQIKNETSIEEINECLDFLQFNQMKNNLSYFIRQP